MAYIGDMTNIGKLAPGGSVAGTLAVLALAITLGIVLGAVPIRRVTLGIAGVFFSALLFGRSTLSISR